MTRLQTRQTGPVCARQGCTRPTKPGALACASDWYALPEPVRQELWDSWRTFRALGHRPPAERDAAAERYGRARLAAYAAWSEA